MLKQHQSNQPFVMLGAKGSKACQNVLMRSPGIYFFNISCLRQGSIQAQSTTTPSTL